MAPPVSDCCFLGYKSVSVSVSPSHAILNSAATESQEALRQQNPGLGRKDTAGKKALLLSHHRYWGGEEDVSGTSATCCMRSSIEWLHSLPLSRDREMGRGAAT